MTLRPLLRITSAALITALLSSTAPAQQVIRVEIDYMENPLTGHSHRPSQQAIDALVVMFACQGITLILDVDDRISHQDVLQCTSPPVWPQTIFDCSGPDSFQAIESVHRDHGSGWHYCLFIHQYDAGAGTGSSGAAEQPGTKLVIACGIFENGEATPWEQAATFAHEFGHNLGLDHFSPTTPAAGRGSFPPNLPSVMSYQYQLRGVKSQLECLGLVGQVHHYKDLDYSSGRMAPLIESALEEQVGVGIHPVDWNCSDTIESAPQNKELDSDLTGPNWCAAPSGSGVLYDYDEWGAIVDVADDSGSESVHGTRRVVTCATLAELTGGSELPSDCYPGYPWPTPPGTVEACSVGEMVWVDGAHFGSQVGTGQLPIRDLDVAVAFSPPGSILYLQPGTIRTSSGSSILITKQLILAGPGGALVSP